MTSHDREFMNRIVDQDHRDRRRRAHHLLGQLRVLRAAAGHRTSSRPRPQYERQQAMLAKEMRFIERFKARAAKAAQVQSRVKKLEKIEKVEPPKRRKTLRFEFSPAPRSGDDVAKLDGVQQGATASTPSTTGFDLLIRRRERWCVMGVNGAGKSTLLKLIAGATPPDAGEVAHRRERQARATSRSTRWICSTRSSRSGRRSCERSRWPRIGLAAHARRLLRLLRRRRREAVPHPLRRREGAPGAGADALRSAELPGPRRADQPPRHGHQGDARRGARELRGHDALRLARPPLPRRAVEPRARAHARGAARSTAADTPSTSRRAGTRRRACGAEWRFPRGGASQLQQVYSMPRNPFQQASR